jgi:Uma2 family endonuclease
VVEVAESSLRKDQRVKARLYAESGVPEYWIVNLAEGRIEVHRDPKDGAYRARTDHGRGEAVTLLGFPDVCVRVDDVLP